MLIDIEFNTHYMFFATCVPGYWGALAKQIVKQTCLLAAHLVYD